MLQRKLLWLGVQAVLGEGKAMLLSCVDALWRGTMHAARRAQKPSANGIIAVICDNCACSA